MKHVAISTAVALTVLTLGALNSNAQTPSRNTTTYAQTSAMTDVSYIIDLSRAKNLARMAAEEANGGLGQYRAEMAMHGPAANSPYVDNGNGTWTFTFLGGRPGYSTPTVQSVVTVDRSNWGVNVDYNGPIRSTR